MRKAIPIRMDATRAIRVIDRLPRPNLSRTRKTRANHLHHHPRNPSQTTQPISGSNGRLCVITHNPRQLYRHIGLSRCYKMIHHLARWHNRFQIFASCHRGLLSSFSSCFLSNRANVPLITECSSTSLEETSAVDRDTSVPSCDLNSLHE